MHHYAVVANSCKQSAVYEIRARSHRCLTGPAFCLLTALICQQVAQAGLPDMLDMIAEQIGIALFLGTVASLEQRCATMSSSSDASEEQSTQEKVPLQPCVGEHSLQPSMSCPHS